MTQHVICLSPFGQALWKCLKEQTISPEAAPAAQAEAGARGCRGAAAFERPVGTTQGRDGRG